MSRKLISLLLAICILLCLSACGTTETSNNPTNTPSESQTDTTQDTAESAISEEIETKLSDSCDMLVCSGNNGDDYYELVVNQIDAYPESTFEFGVIKNNEWFVNMSPNSPFIDENGWWKWSDDENTISSDNFSYISNGCFLYRSSRYGNNIGIMYKPETSVFFEIRPIDDIFEIDASDRFLAYDIHNSVNYDYQLTLFDMNTGSKKVIGGVFKDYFYADKTYAISDDIFYARCNITWNEYEGFYDLNGNIIIDLRETGYSTSYGYVFENGKIILTDYNDSGVKYDLTFDTSGNIINQEKSTVQ
ncbi:MAG: hypothetical protein IJ262_05420 [Clostridia bacterium]|nr:hypothetical protein [Clostridia bacterium]